MTVLTPSQLAGYAANAGFSGQGLINIVAKALAESGGNTQIVNNAASEGSQGSWGVLQINADAHGLSTAQAALDPQFAFNYAYSLSNQGTNFSPWHAQATADQLSQAQVAAGTLGANSNGANLDTSGIGNGFPVVDPAPGNATSGGTTYDPTNPDTWSWYGMSNPYQSGTSTIPTTPGSSVPDKTINPDGTSSSGLTGLATGLGSLSTSVGSLIKVLTDPATWQRTALVALGVTVLVAALFLFGFSMVHNDGRPARA